MEKTLSLSEVLSMRTLIKKKIDDKLVTRSTPSYRASADVSSRFIAYKKKSDDTCNGIPVKEKEDAIRAEFDSIVSLLDNYEKVNQIIAYCNSTVKVTVAGSTMTLIEAIALNNKVVSGYKDQVLLAIAKDFNVTIEAFSYTQNSVNNQELINKYLETVMGKVESASPEMVAEWTKKYHEINDFEIIDPLRIRDRYTAMYELHEEFKATVSTKLAMVNATTMVAVDLDKDTDFFRLLSKEDIASENDLII